MAHKFYKSGDIWLYNEGIDSSVDTFCPSGFYRLAIDGTKVGITSVVNNLPLFTPRYVEVTTIQKSETIDDNYLSVEEFINVAGSFFVGLQGPTDVNLRDQTTDAVIALFNRRTQSTTLSAEAVIGSKTLVVDDATGIVADKYLFVFDAQSLRFSDFVVISVLSNTITVDRAVDYNYPIGANVDAADTNMNVDGSATPVTFGLRGVQSPQGIELSFDLTRIIFACETTNPVDLNKFGDIVGGIANGLLFRTRNGRLKNIFNAKTNAGLAALMYDWTPLEATNPSQGINGFLGRLTFAGQDKIGVAIRLPLGSDAEFIVQDDLTTLISLRVVAEGHIVR